MQYFLCGLVAVAFVGCAGIDKSKRTERLSLQAIKREELSAAAQFAEDGMSRRIPGIVRGQATVRSEVIYPGTWKPGSYPWRLRIQLTYPRTRVPCRIYTYRKSSAEARWEFEELKIVDDRASHKWVEQIEWTSIDHS